MTRTFKSNYSSDIGEVSEMREYILTNKERRILKEWFDSDRKLFGFYQLMNRIKQNYRRLKEDLELIEKSFHSSRV